MLHQSEPPPAACTGIAPGALLAERYRIDSRLGEGGMGVVYLAEHVHIRKRLAIKVLLQEWTSAPEVVARFEQEAVAAGAISHPNVATATDFGRLPDGSFFLVLEYLEGCTLRAALGDGPLPVARALAIARGIALGIGAAHAKGIVHRDLKPENVMLVARDGDPDFVKVLDFGVARVAHRTGPRGEALTSAGTILGTPQYMAPEQALGTQVDARADLYALGVILFEMLTGECPFAGSALTLLRQHVITPAPPLPLRVAERAPPQVRTLLARLLAKDPLARPASASEVIASLHECIAALAPAGPARVVAPSGAAAGGTEITAALLERAETVASGLRAWVSHASKGPLARARLRPKIALIAGIGVALIALTTVAWSGRATSPRAVDAAPARAASLVPSSAASGEASAPPPKSAVLSCLDGRFADHLEQGRPAGDARGIAAAHRAIYWVDFANEGKATQVTLVWTIDGKEAQRQALDVGHAPHWRTWAAHAVRGARAIDVRVLDAAGRLLKQDSITFDG